MFVIPESHRDLLAEVGEVCVFSCFGRDGFPQSTLMAYAYDGEAVRFTAASGKQKVKNVRRDPHATLLLWDKHNTGRSLELRGKATVADDEPGNPWSLRIATGRAPAGEDVAATLAGHTPEGQHRVIITFEPDKANVWPPPRNPR